MDETLKTLIEGIRNRDERALEYVMETYIDVVYFLCRSILKIYEKEDLEECVQDVFISLWKDINKYDEQRGSLKSFILIKARTIALNKKARLIKASRVIPIEGVDFQDNEIIEDEIVSKEQRRELLEAIGSLKKEDREIFIRRYFYNQRIQQISEVLSLSVTAVENRLWRGREKLKGILERNRKRRDIIEE
ncbi:MAG: sigma-70 family RNA polymerase sigma factor [Bacillota bacterium]|nr:sigma-70 family RNA polymerase sigma factor [Bacillota bacterium]